MKKIIIITATLLLSLSVFAGCGNKGTEASSTAPTDVISATASEISNSGSDIEDTSDTESDDGVVDGGFTQDYEYDDQNRVVKVHFYKSDSGELVAETENTYNDDNLLDQIVMKDSNGKVMITNKYKYAKDPNGELFRSRDTYYNSENKVVLHIDYEFSVENNCPITKGYYDGADKEITSDKANQIIADLNSFMYN